MPRAPIVEGVRDRRVLTDGARTLEIHHVRGNLHSEGLLMAYLPTEKLLIQADAWSGAVRPVISSATVGRLTGVEPATS